MRSEEGLLAACFPHQLDEFLKEETAFRVFVFRRYLIVGFISRSPHREPISQRSGFMVFWGVCLNGWTTKAAADAVTGMLEMVIHVFRSNGYNVADLDLATELQRLITQSTAAPHGRDLSLAGLGAQFDRTFLNFGPPKIFDWGSSATDFLRKLFRWRRITRSEFVWQPNLDPVEAIIFFVEMWRQSGMPKNAVICAIRPEISGPVRLILIPDGWAFGKIVTLDVADVFVRVPSDEVTDSTDQVGV